MDQEHTVRGVREAIEAASCKLGSQAKLAEALGVHSNTISGWKNGSRDPGTKTLIRIFELAGLSMDSMFELPSAAATQTVTVLDLAPLLADIEQLKQSQALLLAPLHSFLTSLLAASSIPPKVQGSTDSSLAAQASPPTIDSRQRIVDSAMDAIQQLKNKQREPVQQSAPVSQQPVQAPRKKVSGE
jgi:transcriptional regulator with XRE-family HTH domain